MKNHIKEVYMRPLEEIHPQGAEQLMKAVYVFAVKDYLMSKKYLETHKKVNSRYDQMKSMYEETRWFLGDKLIQSMERLGIKNVRFERKER